MLKEIMKKVVDVKSYINIIEEVADATNNYKLVDKIHYLVNEKLGIKSDLISVSESGLSNHITYCACCGTYLHHNNMHRDVWHLLIDEKDIILHYTSWEDDDSFPYDNEYCINCEGYEEEDEEDDFDDISILLEEEESELDAYLSDMADVHEDVDDDDLPF